MSRTIFEVPSVAVNASETPGESLVPVATLSYGKKANQPTDPRTRSND